MKRKEIKEAEKFKKIKRQKKLRETPDVYIKELPKVLTDTINEYSKFTYWCGECKTDTCPECDVISAKEIAIEKDLLKKKRLRSVKKRLNISMKAPTFFNRFYQDIQPRDYCCLFHKNNPGHL